MKEAPKYPGAKNPAIARMLTPEERASIDAAIKAAEDKKKADLRNARIIQPEELADLRLAALKVSEGEPGKALREREVAPPETPEQAAEKAATAKRERLAHVVSGYIKELKSNINITANRLSKMKQPDIKFAGPRRPRAAKEEIEAMENAQLGELMQSQSLEDVVRSLKNNTPLPLDTILTLRALQQQAANELDAIYTRKKDNPNIPIDLSAAQKKLQSVTTLIREIEG